MKLPLHLGIAALLLVVGSAAAEAQQYYPYPYTQPGYYPAYTSNPSSYNYNYNYNANYPTNTYGGATINPDGSMSNNGVSWNGADPSGGATGVRAGNVANSAAYQNPAAGGASALAPPRVGYGYGRNYAYGTPLRQPVYHVYRPRAFTYHND